MYKRMSSPRRLNHVVTPVNTPASAVEVEIKALEVQNHKNELADAQDKRRWHSCCFTVDKEFVVFIVHTAVLSGIVVYSGAMLVESTDCYEKGRYQSLLSAALGLLIPTPRLTKNH